MEKNKSIICIGLLVSLITSKVKAEESKRINIYYDRNIVCVQRTNNCYAFAKGKKEYPTPTWEGAQVLTTHITNGFDWQNPLNNKVYKKGTHNLGDIWIEFYHDDNTGWSFGFHQTPYPNTPLSLQLSHGCARMTSTDIKNFSNELRYFDEFYIIRDKDLMSFDYLYNMLLT